MKYGLQLSTQYSFLVTLCKGRDPMHAMHVPVWRMGITYLEDLGCGHES